jgi:hypothetical protein
VPTGLVHSERLGGSEVDLEVFQRSAQKLYDDYCNTDHFMPHNLLRGFLPASIVMLGPPGRPRGCPAQPRACRSGA